MRRITGAILRGGSRRKREGQAPMFLVDDILLFPVRSLVWIFREINHAAEKDMAGEPAAITAKLGELYMMLETGQVTEAEFDAAEKTLLDRLDLLKTAAGGGEEE